MLGLSRAQLIGKPLDGLVAEAERDTLAAALSAGRDSSAPRSMRTASARSKPSSA